MNTKYLILFIVFSTALNANNISKSSIVKLFSSVSYYNYEHPWQTNSISNYTGSGVVIDGNKILSSAHVVSGARFLEVQKENDPKKYIAYVKYISHQADLAIIEVEDKEFFADTKALQFNSDVKPRDEITVQGFPLGGQTISTTTGVISRIEYINYVWSGEYLLAIQVDAAINSGNSGGPAVDKNGDIVGIAMMGRKDSSNIAYIVPSIIIKTFLEDIKDGVVDGFGSSGTTVNHIRNDSMKNYFGLKNGDGILVRKVDYETKNFKENDIIIELDGHPIANDATIESRFGRVNCNLILHQKQVGDLVKFKVLRDKEVISFKNPIQKYKPLLAREFDKKPRYIIFGGLAFTPLTQNYISKVSKNGSSIELLFYKTERSEEFNEPVVWMQDIFPHKVNRGYKSYIYVVETLNDIKVKNFKHFVTLIDGLESGFVVIETLEKQKVVLDVKEAKESLVDIKKVYGLGSHRHVE